MDNMESAVQKAVEEGMRLSEIRDYNYFGLKIRWGLRIETHN